MHLSRTVLVLAAAPLCVAAGLASPAAAAAKVPPGPSGPAFYTPRAGVLTGSSHGGAIWERRQTGPDAIRGAARNRLVLYRSIGIDGRAVAVSGSVAVPTGRAPRRGWPVITYAHGTSGIADACAPTRDTGSSTVTPLHQYVYPLLRLWLKAGYAVVRTDYEGLGAPGEHPFLVGRSEGRSTLDMVRAARRVEPRLGRTVVIAGHSQGGHAALWATSLAKAWTPELRIAATVAFAPASHLSEQAALLRGLIAPGFGISALAAMLLRGIDVAGAGIDIPAQLSPPAAALYPQTLTRCVPDLAAPDSFGGLAPAALISPEVDLAPIAAAIDRLDDPENLTLRTPVLIAQGESDTTVIPAFTTQLDQELRAKGANVTYRTYPGVSHVAIVYSAAGDAAAYVARRVR